MTNNANSNFNVCVVSDSSGETATVVLRAVAAQLPDIRIDYSIHPLIKDRAEIDSIIDSINPDKEIIMCTLADTDILEYLKMRCTQKNIHYIEVLSQIIYQMADYFQTAVSLGGRRSQEPDSAFNRIESINFTLKHDDGQNVDTAHKADVILVGVSRTSKSPTSIYLSNRGYKVANVPYVPGCKFPDTIKVLRNKLIIGLTIDAKRLAILRKRRIWDSVEATNYTEVQAVFNEIHEAEEFFRKNHWPVIDVSELSTEEIAALIIKIHQKN